MKTGKAIVRGYNYVEHIITEKWDKKDKIVMAVMLTIAFLATFARGRIRSYEEVIND